MADETEPSKFRGRINGNGLFLIAVSSMAAVVGFGYTYMIGKRNEIKEITSQQTSQKVREQMILMRDGSRLASKALAYSWLWSIGGVSLISFVVWKLSGAHNLAEFRQKAGEVLPRIPKSPNPGRENFASLRELADYLEEEDKRKASENSRSDDST